MNVANAAWKGSSRVPGTARPEAHEAMFPVLLLAALLLAPAPDPASAAEPPAGCSVADERSYVCRWTIENNVPTSPSQEWPIPSFDRTLATVSVTLTTSADTGWRVDLVEDRSGAEVIASTAEHEADRQTSVRHADVSTHVIVAPPGSMSLRFVAGNARTVGVSDSLGAFGTGTYEIAYTATRIPDGEPPVRPAATQADPQLADEAGEVAVPAWDIRAIWWNDERLDDGLFDVHMSLADLRDLDDSAFRAPALGGAADAQVYQLAWKAVWTVEDVAYYVEWKVERPGANEDPAFTCWLRTEAEPETSEVTLAYPLCSVDRENATLHATIPEAAVGPPGAGVPFDHLAGRVRTRYTPGATDVVEQTEHRERYAFALGGPAVWSELNPRLDSVIPQWYEAPLAPENIVDTVQIVGSLAALATFLVGLALVYRRRRQTGALLARVDEVEDSGLDSPETLLRLGRLEQEFSVLFRKHRISEGQYQVLSQRIASVATRFALRRELGLDDGVPGEAGPLRKFSAKRN